MKRLLAIFSAVILLVACVMVFLGQKTNAQGSNGYMVSPVREELVIEKGQSQTVTLTIENATNINIMAKAIVNDFEASDDESGQPRILLDNSSTTGNSFKSLVASIPDFELGPLEKKQIQVTINVPTNASVGGYFGTIRFTNATLSSDSTVTLAASVGTLFLVKVPGELVESLNLIEFTAAKNGSTGRFFLSGGEISIITRLSNNGNIHVKPFGKVTITDRSGKVVETYEFNGTEPRANVLPNSIRKFEDKLQNEKWLGKYTITANLGYGTTGSLITAKNTFWVVPVWVIIVFVIAVLAILIGGYLVYHKYVMTKRHHNRIRRR